MVTYALPSSVEGLIFDMDLTLYRNQAYYDSQITNQVVLLAADLGCAVETLQAKLTQWVEKFQRENGDRKPSFGNTLLGAVGYPIERSVELRRRAIRPEDYLERDFRLEAVFAELQTRFTLVLVTNNPADIARRTLGVLGVERFFPRIIGLDEAGHSKPHPAAFELAFQALEIPAGRVVSVGDRFAVDLEFPLSQGSGGILVESMEDVYSLPRVLPGHSKS